METLKINLKFIVFMRFLKTSILVVTFLLSSTAFAQTVKLSFGVYYSSLDIGELDMFSDRIASVPILLGIDYLENENYYLSSEIGVMRIGGEGKVFINTSEENPLEGYNTRKRETFNIVQINTTFRYKINLEPDFNLFVGAGPKVDFLFNRDFDIPSSLNSMLRMPSYFFGLIGEIGASYHINKFTVSFTGRYNFNFKKDIYNYRHYGMNISLGYRL